MIKNFLRTVFINTIKLFLSALLFLLIFSFVTDSTYIWRGISLSYLKGEKTAGIDDHKYFDNRKVKTDKYQMFDKHSSFNDPILFKKLDQTLKNDETVAFVVLKDGQLLYEKYQQGYSADSLINNFSMTKSISSMLYFKAVEDGYIGAPDTPITDLLPEYAGNKYAVDCTIADLVAMTAGFDWREEYYMPLNPTTKAYYGKDVEKHVLSHNFIKPCGNFNYQYGASQLLNISLERALKPNGYTLSSYLEKSLWQPLGMKRHALWSLDGDKKTEKAGGLHTTALDLAKLGQLLLNNGEWQGKQILSVDHTQLITSPNVNGFSKGEKVSYGHGVWVDVDSPISSYAMTGLLGQRVIVVPEKQLVIIRLGRGNVYQQQKKGFMSEKPDVYFYITQVLKAIEE